LFRTYSFWAPSFWLSIDEVDIETVSKAVPDLGDVLEDMAGVMKRNWLIEIVTAFSGSELGKLFSVSSSLRKTMRVIYVNASSMKGAGP
jgi:hypothetical protein